MAKGNVLAASIAGAVGLGAGILLGRTVLAPSTRPSGKGDYKNYKIPAYAPVWEDLPYLEAEGIKDVGASSTLESPLDCVSSFRDSDLGFQARILREVGAPDFLVQNILSRQAGAVEGALLWLSQQSQSKQNDVCSRVTRRVLLPESYRTLPWQRG